MRIPNSASIFLGALLLSASAAHAQDKAAPPPAAEKAAPAPGTPDTEAAPANASAAKPAPTAEEVGDAAASLIRPDRAMRSIQMAAALAVLFRFLLALLARFVVVMRTRRHAFRIASLALGAAVLLLERYAGGGTWMEAGMAALGGPGAILVNEFMKMLPSKKKVEKKAATPPPA